jgi:hypothetical protein
MLLPHSIGFVADMQLQDELQSSPPAQSEFLSHSSPLSLTPLPQTERKLSLFTQLHLSHVSSTMHLSLSLPSHISPGSTIPLPHIAKAVALFSQTHLELHTSSPLH